MILPKSCFGHILVVSIMLMMKVEPKTFLIHLKIRRNKVNLVVKFEKRVREIVGSIVLTNLIYILPLN